MNRGRGIFPMRGGMMGPAGRVGRPLGGGGGRGGGPGVGFGGFSGAVAQPRPPFDLALCEPMFPRVTEYDDSALSQALISRNTDLTPTSTNHTILMNLITKITDVLEKFVVSPDSFTSATIEEVRQVGSLKKGTMLEKHNVGDLAVVLKTLPTTESVTAIGNRIIEELKATEKEPLRSTVADFGCEISSKMASIRILITTVPSNMKKLDPTIHLNEKILYNNMAAIRHARYFEENASHSTIKVLVRILKDIRSRFQPFRAMNVWMVELLAYYAIMNTPNHQPLPLNQAFRRCFQLLAAGIFLPASAGIMDPCEVSGVRVQEYMTYEEQDNVCCLAQTLLRVLCYGGYKAVLGMEAGGPNVASEMSVWDGVVVSPLEKVYVAECMPSTEEQPAPTTSSLPSLMDYAY